MSDKLTTILQAARDHAEQVILPNVDAWNAAKKWPRQASDCPSSEFLEPMRA